MTEFSDTGPGEPRAPLGPPPGAPPYAYPSGGHYPPPPYSGFPPAHAPGSNGLGIGALMTGILAVLTSWTVVGGLGLGIVAAVIGLAGRRGEAINGAAAVVGTLLGITAAALSGVLLAVLILVFETGWLNEDYQHCLGEHNGMSQYCDQYR